MIRPHLNRSDPHPGTGITSTAASSPLGFQAQANPFLHRLPTETVEPAPSLISSQPPNGVLPSNSSLSLTPPQLQRSAEANLQRGLNYGIEELSTGGYPLQWPRT